MTNQEIVRDYILKQFQTQMDVPYRNIGIEHTLQVVSYGLMLSKQRKLNDELLIIACYFHDIATYISHYSQNHALRSAKIAQDILPAITNLSSQEIQMVIEAIKNHSNKGQIDDLLSEALKDADTLSHYYSSVIGSQDEQNRLSKLLG